ncbi:NADH-ubiquinone oxidoreductase chain 4L [Xylanimonas cellulosilytica DSM 15894]|uniref:NADH-ubiquinone oxidoreductase chain 4L n=1 Tax=Xylanimonas cellulosilytica (strain DSM 15894 / JCM 12276 / CECT 5975 / KCTC 9989 / LMG 20990 / NBRC 107835 / XIL07) TaxID=446471 RepID=D1BT19_XYLCX|nr:cation:proton antiporter subunit C [Xylanimonas cellulosilytica]ACZ30861.1 NADH-ubiquinone oxidoreductase chain 4L [Xylanimonas cellulosilytica DSM 15894]
MPDWFTLDWLDGPNTAVILFFVGLAGMCLRKNMMITVIATSIMNTAIILAFVTMFSSTDHSAPMVAETVAEAADPLPQALMITSVVIGVAVQAVSLVLVLGYYRQHKTLDWDEARALREGVEPAEADPFLRLRDAVTHALRPVGGTGSRRS